jgi:hypothetical protein
LSPAFGTRKSVARRELASGQSRFAGWELSYRGRLQPPALKEEATRLLLKMNIALASGAKAPLLLALDVAAKAATH